MAPPTRRQKKALAAAPPPPVTDAADPVIDPADRISSLPKDIQAHILSFLPAQEAVQTCVLARTWRDVWKSARHLLITGDSVKEVREFVDRLLINFSSLDACEIRFDLCKEFDDDEDDDDEHYDLDDEDTSSLKRWVRRVLKCQIQMLRVDIDAQTYLDAYFQMSDRLLVSRHLTRLELTGVWFICRCLTLDGCPALEHVEINECCLLDVRTITSLSLKHLVITSCESNNAHNRIRICVPRLVSLLLDGRNQFRTPLLERMPELVRAEIWIGSSMDWCRCDDPVACYHVTRDGDTSDTDSDSDDQEGSGDYAGQNTTKCVVLEGLAQARDLVLTTDYSTYILRRDLRWCPTFSNLKTLVLTQNYYCDQPADCSVLECMLEHAPLLEKLTLTLRRVPQDRGYYKVEIKGYPTAKVTSTKISQQLQIVEIICDGVNEICGNILNLLDTLNICFEARVTKKMMNKQLSH